MTTNETFKGWELDTTNGCLYHPNGVLTSWCRKVEGNGWFMYEPAATVYPVSVIDWLSKLG